jgi:hypothetical protein
MHTPLMNLVLGVMLLLRPFVTWPVLAVIAWAVACLGMEFGSASYLLGISVILGMSWLLRLNPVRADWF